MACLIASPSSGSGKTLLSLVLLAWARCHGFSVQPFKVGPDYLDAQHLSGFADRPCRNLDLILSGPEWVRKSFHGYGSSSDFVLVEGAMGLFDGVGTTQDGSSSSIAGHLNLPVVLVVNASGQAASLAALVNGFRNHDPKLKIAGVVLNNVNSLRHKVLLNEVLEGIGVKVLGCLPRKEDLSLPSRHLGLIPPHEILDLERRIKIFSDIAINHLDLDSFRKLLIPPTSFRNPIDDCFDLEKECVPSIDRPIAVAMDNAFHFRYQETEDCLNALKIPFLPWSPLSDQPLPTNAEGLLLPGGFPEHYASDLSKCSSSLQSLRSFFGKRPIYAECGGMMILGQAISDDEGKEFKMSGLLPFSSVKGELSVGYRYLSGRQNSMLIREGENIIGHEFHRWRLIENERKLSFNTYSPWEMSGWSIGKKNEGWSNKLFHASWIHLHWPSRPEIALRWRKALDKASEFIC